MLKLSQFAIVLSCVFAARISSAQCSIDRQVQPSPADLSVARTTFERGVQALNESRFAEAATAFEESCSLNPVPVVRFNLAFAYRGLGRVVEAVRLLDVFLASPGNTPAESIAAGRAELDRLRTVIVRVDVRATPADARVLVDGRAPERDQGTVLLDPGRHVVIVSRDGYRPFQREITYADGAREELVAALEIIDTEGRLRVEPSVPAAAVTIDGAVAGTGIVERPVRAGVHIVEIRADGYVPIRREVRVGGTGLVRVDAVLIRPRSSPWPWLGPTIGVGAAGALALGWWALWEGVLRPTANPPTLADQWGEPIR